METGTSPASKGRRIRQRLNMHIVAGLVCLVLAAAAAFFTPLVAAALVLGGITSVSIGVIKNAMHHTSDDGPAIRSKAD